MPSQAEVSTTLEQVEGTLVSLRDLMHHLDRELRSVEEFVDVGHMSAPITERLHESVFHAGAMVPSRQDPHVVSARLSVRFVSAIDNVTEVSFDTAPNRVTAWVMELVTFRISSWLAATRTRDAELIERLSRARSQFIALRRTPNLASVSALRPTDLLHRSLRLAPKYRAVLELHTLLQREV